jgi:3-oxoadipate enol-lactonase
MMRTVYASDGARLCAYQAGGGAPVICISGLGYSSWCWRETVEAFSPAYGMITLDNRGTGDSDAPQDGYTIDQFAADTAAALTTFTAEPAHVVGHSMGGYIALTLAVRHPSLVRSLVLIGTGSGGAGSLPVPEPTQTAWKSAADLPADQFARQTMPLSYATGWSEANPERFERLLQERIARPTPTDVWKKQFRAAGFFGRDGMDVSRVAVPALVIHGTDDRVIPFANGERLAAQMERAQLETMPGAGHLCFLEQPQGFQALLASWFAG